jgi:hypothetical protein
MQIPPRGTSRCEDDVKADAIAWAPAAADLLQDANTSNECSLS